MIDQVKAWRDLATEFGIEVIAPCNIRLKDGSRVQATAHVKQFGAANGMIIDPDYAVLMPHKDALIANGYGYSTVELSEQSDRAMTIEMLADWSWSSPQPHPPWLPQLDRPDSH